MAKPKQTDIEEVINQAEAEAPQAEALPEAQAEAEAPQAEALPEAQAEAEAPQAEALPEAQAEAEAPQAEAPQAEAPQAEAPQAEAPQAEAPQAEALPEAQAEAEAPQAEAPQAEAPQAEAPQAEAPQAEAPQAEALPEDLKSLLDKRDALVASLSEIDSKIDGYIDEFCTEMSRYPWQPNHGWVIDHRVNFTPSGVEFIVKIQPKPVKGMPWPMAYETDLSKMNEKQARPTAHKSNATSTDTYIKPEDFPASLDAFPQEVRKHAKGNSLQVTIEGVQKRWQFWLQTACENIQADVLPSDWNEEDWKRIGRLVRDAR